MTIEIEVMDVIADKFDDLEVPGFITEVSPIEAELMGAFYEEALDMRDALEAMYD
ncbi:TPA: hypothetical protein ACGTP6_000913 [Legionella pneumophila]|uniref:hypothetical protein n=1 Tax=Legionella pneumophila TaxID=446 RepID=UPI0015E8830B|nr:hypothetical protein [Legionella pneumophila]MCZ4682197.1 hypothetical protein [Legionella pneumophila]HBI2947053.1 hypothetical protein [Legionella pneumophila]